MQKLKQYWAIILLIVIILGGMFYWYSYRPEQIRKNCYRFANNGMAETIFRDCLLSNGLKN